MKVMLDSDVKTVILQAAIGGKDTKKAGHINALAAISKA